MHKLILETELVPETCWYTNLRSILTQKNWRMLSQAVRERSGGVCPICGMETPMEELDAHETWGYNDITHEQYLEKIVGICDNCHMVKHIGKTNIDGLYEVAREWHAAVNDVSVEESEKIIANDFQVWKERSQHDWRLLIDPNVLLEYMSRDWVVSQIERLEERGVLLKWVIYYVPQEMEKVHFLYI